MGGVFHDNACQLGSFHLISWLLGNFVMDETYRSKSYLLERSLEIETRVDRKTDIEGNDNIYGSDTKVEIKRIKLEMILYSER